MRETSSIEPYKESIGGTGQGYSRINQYCPSKALLATVCVTIFMLATLAYVSAP